MSTPMKLFRVTMELETVVLAESPEHALNVADRWKAMKEELYNRSVLMDGYASELVPGMAIPEGWGDCPPWGADDELTVEQILKGEVLPPVEQPDTQTLPMFPKEG